MNTPDHIRRFGTTQDRPDPNLIRQIREWLRLSQSEFAAVLGFGRNGDKTIRDLEVGSRQGLPFDPTNTSIVALRGLVALKLVTDAIDGREAKDIAYAALPELVQ